jgi:hypothetical protein
MKVIGFEDVQQLIQKKKTLIINLLPNDEQNCLIEGTLNAEMEEKVINEICENYNMKHKTILLYGKNSSELYKLQEKHTNLISLGFSDIYVYLGGLFEWMLLQDIYGPTFFPTTARELDIIRFRPKPII